MGLTEKFKENSCKLILYVINETFHSYVNIKCLTIFSSFFFLSSYWAPPPWPPLYICLFYRRVGGLAWGHILLRGRINSWVLWLIHWTNSCSPSYSPLLKCPSHPRRGAARRHCLPLPQLLKLSSLSCKKCTFLDRSSPRPPKAEVWCEQGLVRGEGHSRLDVAATSLSVWARFSRAPLLESSGFGTAVPVWSWGWMTVVSIWVKSFWCVAEKGLLRTAEKRVGICADIRSEVSEAGLGFCLGSLPPSFNVTEN